MKILWVAKMYFDLTVDRTTWIEMIRNLQREGHETKMLTAFKNEKLPFGLEGSIEYVPSIKHKVMNHISLNVSIFLWLFYFLFFWRADVVLLDFNTCVTALPFAILRRLRVLRADFLLDVRSVPVETEGFLGSLSERLFGLSVRVARFWFQGMTVITPFMKEVLAERFRLDRQRIGIWSSGVSVALFDPESIPHPERERKREELGLKGKFVVMYHGSIGKRRGLHECVEAMSFLEGYSDIHLLVVGQGPAKEELERLTYRLNVQGRVTLKDTVPYEEIPLYISVADVGILPFPNLMWWRVSSPIKLMEYLAMEKPVIVTDIEAHRDVLGSEGIGFFTASDEPARIADGILDAYHSREKLGEIGSKGRHLVEERFTWERQAKSLNSFLQRWRTTWHT